jgi:hypothetical protein
MKKVREYRQRAKECRDLGDRAGGDLRAHYDDMARVWDKLAEERLTFFVEHPEEHSEEEVATEGGSLFG